jgi:hypothetical protein
MGHQEDLPNQQRSGGANEIKDHLSHGTVFSHARGRKFSQCRLLVLV